MSDNWRDTEAAFSHPARPAFGGRREPIPEHVWGELGARHDALKPERVWAELGDRLDKLAEKKKSDGGT